MHNLYSISFKFAAELCRQEVVNHIIQVAPLDEAFSLIASVQGNPAELASFFDLLVSLHEAPDWPPHDGDRFHVRQNEQASSLVNVDSLAEELA